MIVRLVVLRRLVPILLLAAAATTSGCGKAGPIYIGAWHTDLTPIKNNDVQKFFADALKFTVKINADGTLVSSWTDADGKEQARSGTWKELEGDGLRWQLTLTLTQPKQDSMTVKLVSTSNRGLSIESLEPFRNEGGSVHFKKR